MHTHVYTYVCTFVATNVEIEKDFESMFMLYSKLNLFSKDCMGNNSRTILLP